MAKDKIEIAFLGGLGEIGKNMLALSYKDETIIIDAGMKFAREEMYGVDFVIPDFSYLLAQKKKIKAILLTHGHEDHIGALPFLLEKIKVPVYGTKLTIGLCQEKLKEKGLLKGAILKEIKPRHKVKIANFEIDFLRVCHSIPGGVALAIQTPLGTIIHTGDFKVDYTPIDKEVIDLNKFAELGNRKVLMLLSDSTNADMVGVTPSEKSVGGKLANIFLKASGRIIIASFASHIPRIQQIIWQARKHGRQIALSGRSMETVVKKAHELGYLKFSPKALVSLEEVKKLPPEKVVIITTGSQGEPMSALARMGRGEHRQIKIKQGDTVVISAMPIPGNQKLVAVTIDNLFRRGADVIYEERMGIHTSGHGAADELKLILSLTKPKYFIPLHGEYRHLATHKKLALEVGVLKDNILIAENGDLIELSSKGVKKLKKFPAGAVMVSGGRAGEIGTVVLKERKFLSQEGVLMLGAVVAKKSGKVLSEIEVESRGFVFLRESRGLIAMIKDETLKTLNDFRDLSLEEKKLKIRERVGKLLYKKVKKNPTIISLINEV